MRQTTALTVAIVLAFAGPLAFAQQGPGQLAGSAKDEAKKPYADYNVRARAVASGIIVQTVVVDPAGRFVLRGLPSDQYVVELVKQNNVVCTEGPYSLSPTKPEKNDINFACRVPTAAYILAAAAAAGIAAAVTRGPASPSK